MNYIIDFFIEFVSLTNDMSPYLLLGFLFAGIIHIYVKKETVSKRLGKKNFKSVLYASLLGVPLPLCSCGVIPTGVSFHKDGASKGATVSFLISTPQTGVDSILATYSLLGLPFAIIRPFIALITGIFGGVVTNAIDDTKQEIIDKEKTKENKIVKMFKYAFVDLVDDIAKWLVIGLLIATAIAVIVPDDFFTSYIGNEYLSMLIVLVASIPLYVCATGSVPIAAVLLMKGLSPGAAIVFLMAGPATNAATMTVIGKAIGKKALFSYLGTIIAGALFFGIIINNFIPREFFEESILKAGHIHEHEIFPAWFTYTCSISLAALISFSMLKKLFKRKEAKSSCCSEGSSCYSDNNVSTKTKNGVSFTVKGMTCNHCKESVEKNLMKLDDINSVDVDLASGKVTVTGDNIDLKIIEETINSLGYEYKK